MMNEKKECINDGIFDSCNNCLNDKDKNNCKFYKNSEDSEDSE